MPRETDARLDDVENLMTQGATMGQIIKFVVDKWKVGERQARRYVERAAKRLDDAGPQARINAMQLAVYRKAMAGGKVGAATSALDRVARAEAAKVLGPERYTTAGKPPMGDTLQGAAWMQRIMLLSADEIIADASLSPAQRRDELRKTAARVAGLVSFDDLNDAKKRVTNHAEEKAREDAEVKTEEVDDEDDMPVATSAPRGR